MPFETPSPDEIKEAVKQVFHRCQQQKPKRLFTALLPLIKTAMPGRTFGPDVFDREMHELSDFVVQLDQVVTGMTETQLSGEDREDSARLVTRLKTMVYCHIMEADYPPLILLNLLRILNDKDCCFLFARREQDDSIRTDKDGGMEIYEHPNDKYGLLRREDKSTNTRLGDILKRLWCGAYRNAFSHAQYYIETNGMFIGTKPLSGVTGRPMSEDSPSLFLMPDHVDALYKGALTFLWTFMDEYRASIAPYKDGKGHLSELSRDPLFWDEERQWWTWGKCQSQNMPKS